MPMCGHTNTYTHIFKKYKYIPAEWTQVYEDGFAEKGETMFKILSYILTASCYELQQDHYHMLRIKMMISMTIMIMTSDIQFCTDYIAFI